MIEIKKRHNNFNLLSMFIIKIIKIFLTFSSPAPDCFRRMVTSFKVLSSSTFTDSKLWKSIKNGELIGCSFKSKWTKWFKKRKKSSVVKEKKILDSKKEEKSSTAKEKIKSLRAKERKTPCSKKEENSLAAIGRKILDSTREEKSLIQKRKLGNFFLYFCNCKKIKSCLPLLKIE